MEYLNINTVKTVYADTSIKQSPVLKCYFFLVLSGKISYALNLFESGEVKLILWAQPVGNFKEKETKKAYSYDLNGNVV